MKGKKVFYLLVILLSTALALVAQQGQTADAIQKELTTAVGRRKVELINELLAINERRYTEELAAYAEQAADLAIDLNYPAGAYPAAIYLSNFFLKQYKRSKARKYTDLAIEVAVELGDKNKELEARKLSLAFFKTTRRKAKIEEAQLKYDRLKNELLFKEKEKKLDLVQQNIDSTEQALDMAIEQRDEIMSEKEYVELRLSMTEEERAAIKAKADRLSKEKILLKYEQEKLKNEKLEKDEEIKLKERELERQNEELQRQRLINIIMGGGFVAIIIIGFLIYRDIRKRRKEAAIKARLEKQIMRQEKLATLGQLSAGIAHEIKNPLNFINNFAEGSGYLTDELIEVLEEGKANAQTDYELLEELTGELKQNAIDIVHHGKRVDRIVKSMMDHTRAGQGNLLPTNINELAGDHIDLAYQSYRAGQKDFNCDIQKKLDRSLPLIPVIPQDLSRVLINIVNNACDAMQEKLLAQGPTYQPALFISTYNVNGGAEIRIKDNGPGIPEAIREKIFDPFFTTKPTGLGNTGLGLSISHEIIVKAHNGQIDIDSIPGESTEFIIFLPAKVIS